VQQKDHVKCVELEPTLDRVGRQEDGVEGWLARLADGGLIEGLAGDSVRAGPEQLLEIHDAPHFSRRARLAAR
jgi:hypothetical protein